MRCGAWWKMRGAVLSASKIFWDMHDTASQSQLMYEEERKNLMKRILIADREESSRLYADELVKEGHHVRCLSNGFAAVREIVTNPPDLVIVDGILPGISGTDLVMMIKSSHPGLPVIMYTDCQLYKDSYMAWSADQCLVKSEDRSQLVSSVRRLIARSERPRFAEVLQ